MCSTPIAFFIFNRARHTRVSFEAIRIGSPRKLFIIADGPRDNHSTDAEQCKLVREIVNNIDWPCEVYRNYSDSNLGLKRRVSSGLDWVFGQVDRAIVLEDDCVAHPDFFVFCEHLLARYEHDEHVAVITGNNFQNGRKRGDAAYYFSKYPHCWGWATWRRTWHNYRGDIPFWPTWSKSKDWTNMTPDAVERRYWYSIFDRVVRGEIDSWAYPWTASVWFKGGFTVTPNVNLVSNIGFGPDATHTIAVEDRAGLTTSPLGLLTHPCLMVQDKEADRYVFDNHFGGIHLRWRIRLLHLPKRILRAGYRRTKKFLTL